MIEVADTSLECDRAVKLPRYAGAGIGEVWLVDLTTDHVEVYCAPTPDGYGDVRRVAPGEDMTVLAFPGVSFAASRIVGPPA